MNPRIWKACARCLASALLLSALAAAQSFEQLGEAFVKDTLALDPVGATQQGVHSYKGVNLDQNLTSFSLADAHRSIAVYEDYLRRLKAIKPASEEDAADLEVMRLQCEFQLLDIRDIESYRHNPTMFVEMIGNALYNPLIQNYAPERQRIQHILARLQQVPQAVEAAKQSMLAAPEIWIRVAKEENDGDIGLIDSEIRPHVPADLKPQFDSAATQAIAALKSFSEFLDKSVNHGGDWRLGQKFYDRKFSLMLATGDTPEQTLHDAEAKLQSIRADMARQARAVFPKYFPNEQPPTDENALISRVLDKVAQQHTTPENYFADAKRDLARVTEFVKEKNLLALPDSKNLQVIPTPEFMRGIYGVGGFAPAPALQPQLGAFYWITPFTKDMSAQRVESKLREYNHWGLETLTIHEAMPGHYVQFQYASQVKPYWRGILRDIYSNTPYVEGWAVYATQIVIDAGFEDTPEMRLTFGKQMLRVVANTILDVKLQTMHMTDAEAMDLMVRQTFQEQEEAQKKLQRAKLSSCQLPTYFVGWRGWNAVRDAYKAAAGTRYSLPDFNERGLREGAVPLPQLQQLLLHELRSETERR